MNSSVHATGNVIPLRAPAGPASGPRADSARYLCQMTLELEQLANTAGMELVAYFLAMARAEAETFAANAAPPAEPGTPQAPYRAE